MEEVIQQQSPPRASKEVQESIDQPEKAEWEAEKAQEVPSAEKGGAKAGIEERRAEQKRSYAEVAATPPVERAEKPKKPEQVPEGGQDPERPHEELETRPMSGPAHEREAQLRRKRSSTEGQKLGHVHPLGEIYVGGLNVEVGFFVVPGFLPLYLECEEQPKREEGAQVKLEEKMEERAENPDVIEKPIGGLNVEAGGTRGGSEEKVEEGERPMAREGQAVPQTELEEQAGEARMETEEAVKPSGEPAEREEQPKREEGAEVKHEEKKGELIAESKEELKVKLEKLVVITGALSGMGHPFGEECAKEFLKRHGNWTVYLTDPVEATGQTSVRRLKDEHQLDCKFYHVDPNSMSSLQSFRDFLTEEHGQNCIDILINNVDYLPNVRSPATGESFTPDQALFEEIVRTNYFGSLSVCLELFPLLTDNARVVFHASRFAQVAYMHTKEEIQHKFRGCVKLEQVNELMNNFISSGVSAINDSKTGWLKDKPTLKVYRNYTLGAIYAYGIANLGVSLSAFCYQRQFEEEKAGRNMLINACCPGLEKDKPAEEEVDTALWLADELPSESNIKGSFVADRKVIDPFVIPTGQELL